MANTKISEYSSTPGNNTDIDGINIAEGCAPSGINNAIRELMSQLKDFQAGTAGDSFNGPHNGTVGATTPASGAFTTLSTTGNTTLGNDSGDVITINGTTTFGAGATVSSPLALSAGTASAPALTTTGDTNTGIFFPAADTIAFAEGGAEVARFDSSGNLGLGVTPSAWGSFGSSRAIQLTKGALSSLSGGPNDYIALSTNSFADTSSDPASAVWKYVATGNASLYEGGRGGQHRWFTAPSGTAGNAISFTQAMTLTAGGDLGVGGTSPYARISAYVASSGTFQNAFGATNSANSDFTVRIRSGISDINNSAGALTFSTIDTERARIDSSGNLLVGTTSQPNPSFAARLAMVQPNANALAIFQGTNAGGAWGVSVSYTASSPNSTGNEAFGFSDSTTTRFVVRSNGGIANFQGNNVNLSDRREKTNFAPAKSYLETICAIPVQTFNYIDQNMEEDPGLTLGVVAQDVQAVAPELVMESNWAKEGDEPKMRLSIYQTDLQYALMKALQELKAEFDAYKASHP
jgi:hypothetical protein